MKTVLFAGVHGAGRSQMAAAWFGVLANRSKARAIAAGGAPAASVHPEVLAAMKEVGVDLSRAEPLLLSKELASSAALLVTMGCGEACPVVPGLRREDWPLEDPKGKPIERVRRIRDDVKARVLALLAREGWAAGAPASDNGHGVTQLPNISPDHLDIPDHEKLGSHASTHPPRILLLYGSLRDRSYSRFLTLEAARLLEHFGAEARVFDPQGLPMPDSTTPDHPKVQELRALSEWSEGHVWCSPERHGTITGVFKSQIDWLPLNVGSVRPTQGRTLAVMQVCGGSQSFNAVNQLRVLGRWMRMVTIPNQSSVAKAFNEFDAEGRMKPSSYYNRIVDVMEELMKFTLLLRDRSDYLTDRYSERVESAEEVSKRVNQRSI